MNKTHRWLFALLLIVQAVQFVALLNLGGFAAKGPRYTKLDGDREASERTLADMEILRQQEAERQQRITSDLALAARIDELHRQINPQP